MKINLTQKITINREEGKDTKSFSTSIDTTDKNPAEISKEYIAAFENLVKKLKAEGIPLNITYADLKDFFGEEEN